MNEDVDFLETLHLIKSVLDELNIPFFLHGGSCLGLVRDGGLVKVNRNGSIAIDTDIDVGIFGDYVERFDEIVNAFVKHGYYLHEKDWSEIDLRYETKTDFLKDLPEKYRRLIHLRKKGHLHIDIIFFFRHKDLIWYCWSGPVYIIAAYPISWFENLYEIEVNGEKFNLPHDPEKYLEDEYGNGKRIRELCIKGELVRSYKSNWKVKEHYKPHIGVQLMRESLWRARRMNLFKELKGCLKS